MTSSYQRRKRDIKYLDQCVKELEIMTIKLAELLKEKGGKVPLFDLGVTSLSFLTPYNSDSLWLALL